MWPGIILIGLISGGKKSERQLNSNKKSPDKGCWSWNCCWRYVGRSGEKFWLRSLAENGISAKDRQSVLTHTGWGTVMDRRWHKSPRTQNPPGSLLFSPTFREPGAIRNKASEVSTRRERFLGKYILSCRDFGCIMPLEHDRLGGAEASP